MTGDISDWRMVAVISDRGMRAYLRNMEDPTIAVEELFREKWDVGEGLLARIENAVYDHPQILDDFTSEIIVTAPRALWMPAVQAEEDDELPFRIYNSVYSAREEDLSVDEFGELLNLYSLEPGLLPFLQRTFPGARVSNHLTILARRFREMGGDYPRLYIDVRDAEADFILYDGDRLLLGVTLPRHTLYDISYYVSTAIDEFGLRNEEIRVAVSGSPEEAKQVIDLLRERIPHLIHTVFSGAPQELEMPVVAALALRYSPESFPAGNPLSLPENTVADRNRTDKKSEE